jgi:hypothetical protein
MTRTEWEWFVAWAVWQKELTSFRWIVKNCPLNFGREQVMRRCGKCGREYFHDCIPCSFRNGGEVGEGEGHEDDLLEQMTDLQTDRGFKLENALRWMRVPLEV